MAIARKYRRPIEVRGRKFLWWVYEDLEETGALTLGVASTDKRFLVRYAIHQSDDSRYLTVLGEEFAGLPSARSTWTRLRCPPFSAGDAVKPSDVRRVIEWCLHTDRGLVHVDWMGGELGAGAMRELLDSAKPKASRTGRPSPPRQRRLPAQSRRGRGQRTTSAG